jgi:hypothetical protein
MDRAIAVATLDERKKEGMNPTSSSDGPSQLILVIDHASWPATRQSFIKPYELTCKYFTYPSSISV